MSTTRHQLQWKRKLLHIANGSIGIWFYVFSGLSEPIVLGILGGFVFLFLLGDVLRMKSVWVRDFYFRYFSGFIRKEEAQTLSSATRGLGAALIMLLIFPRPVNILVMMFVTYGDPIGAIIGYYFGKHRFKNGKSLEGSLAVWLLGSLICYLTLPYLVRDLTQITLVSFALLGGFLASLAEGIFDQWDDNVTIPLLAAPGLFLLMKVYGFL